MTPPPDQNHIVNAKPTKQFFIEMLVRDIGLVRAIIDLVDNSIDGAHRFNSGGNFEGLWVHITANETEFAISDNCGGITPELARNYAFRFGRSADQPPTPGSVGLFGVGMKRTLFKLGREFSVESISAHARFSMHVDIDEWERSDDWTFRFDDLDESEQDVQTVGTMILVRRLETTVKDDFVRQNFLSQLAIELEAAEQEALSSGLEIKLNDLELNASRPQLLSSSVIKPAARKYELLGGELRVRLYAGVAESVPRTAGWDLFCNGRLVLEADKSGISGWGEQNEQRVPRYHNQFARFRGIVYLESADGRNLPWNTTKTGVDSDSSVFKAVRAEMVLLMRPVIDFLNLLETEESEGSRVLHQALDEARLTTVASLPFRQVFNVSLTTRQVPTMRTIQYSKPREQVDAVRDALGVTTAKQVGEMTFDYYYQSEVEQ